MHMTSVEFVVVGAYALAFHVPRGLPASLSRATFLTNKRAVGRPKDLADIEAIEPRS